MSIATLLMTDTQASSPIRSRPRKTIPKPWARKKGSVTPMKATDSQQVRASYPNAQETNPTGADSSTAPTTRSARAVPRNSPPRSGFRATSRIT